VNKLFGSCFSQDKGGLPEFIKLFNKLPFEGAVSYRNKESCFVLILFTTALPLNTRGAKCIHRFAAQYVMVLEEQVCVHVYRAFEVIERSIKCVIQGQNTSKIQKINKKLC
jgi:hypothetical protein